VNSLETNTVEKGSKNFVVKLFVNEKEVTIPACDGWLCYYDKVKTKYQDYINKCNIKEICGSKPDDEDSPGNKANLIMVCSMTGQLAMLLFLLLLI
jgi:hypothetical protein